MDDLYHQHILSGGGLVEKILATLDVTIKTTHPTLNYRASSSVSSTNR
jgi:hypothetical protein